MKKLEEHTPEELTKTKKTLTVLLIVMFTLMGLYLGYGIYRLVFPPASGESNLLLLVSGFTMLGAVAAVNGVSYGRIQSEIKRKSASA